jgi:hypothetical protein
LYQSEQCQHNIMSNVQLMKSNSLKEFRTTKMRLRLVIGIVIWNNLEYQNLGKSRFTQNSQCMKNLSFRNYLLNLSYLTASYIKLNLLLLQ